MEELLPLIIGIVWVVYSLYSRGQKKKGRTPQTEKTNRQPSLLEQILSGQGISIPVETEESKPDFIYDYVEEPVSIINEPVKKNEPLPFLSAELNNIREEGESSFKNYFEKEDVVTSDDEDTYWDLSEEVKDFDMRKAIIYSEILNAPYIDYK